MLFFAKISIASVIAGVVCFELTGWLQARVAWQSRPTALMMLVSVTAVGLIIAALVARVLGITELQAYFRRGRTVEASAS